MKIGPQLVGCLSMVIQMTLHGYIVIVITRNWQKTWNYQKFFFKSEYTELMLENMLKSLNLQAVMLIMCFTLISSVDHNSGSEETVQDTLSRNCKLLSIIISSFTVSVGIQE